MSPPADADRDVDTVIVGTGPSALILSFILHGNIPYYDLENPHPDPILHKKLSQSPCLLKLDVDDLTAHFDASRISYSTQALPVNVLLDTLLRPLSDVEPGEHPPSLVWRKEPQKAIKHVVIGDTPKAGGQWASNPVDASWDIGTLSYLEQLSLPQYTLFDHLKTSPDAMSQGAERPTRRQIADYLAAYPAAVGIQESIRVGTVGSVSRTKDGFSIGSHSLTCKHLVLASGIFNRLIPPPAILKPLPTAATTTQNTDTLLVIGSGFSAADVIISNVQERKIVHVFKWQPIERPSPLQACHPQAYPDYAGVYRQMKQASKKYIHNNSVLSPTPRKQKQFFDEWVWSQNYIGLPNAEIVDVETHAKAAVVHLRLPDGQPMQHNVSSLEYVVGRRGSLHYLAPSLEREVIGPQTSRDGSKDDATDELVSGRTLRDKAEANVEVAPRIFAIGSLSGDSLIRFAYGGCVQAASKVFADSDDSNPEKMKLWADAVSKEEVAMGTVVPLNGGHEDLGQGPRIRSPTSSSRFSWARRKSSCVVS